MREIKARAWESRKKEWHYFSIPQDIGREVEGMSNKLHYEHWGLFTGLHDKNGKEIWEGDIVAHMVIDWERNDDPDDSEYDKEPEKEDTRDVVVMDRFPRYWLKNETRGYEGEDLVDCSECVVLGNIYETPGLINEPH